MVALAAAVLAASPACGGRPLDADPLASMAEAVSEDERATAPLVESWRRTPETPLTLRPAVGANNVYLALGNQLVAWEVTNGASRWTPVNLDSEISAAPVALGQQVVVATRGDDSAGLRPRVLWFANDSTLVRQVPVADAISEISAVPGTLVYIDRRGVGRLGGGLEWHTAVEGPATVELAIDHGLAYVTTTAGELLAFDVLDGSLRWRHDAGGSISRASVAAGRVYVGGGELDILALRASDGHVAWRRILGIAVVGAPGYVQDLVWVAALDAKLHAYKASNGTEIGTLLVELSSRNYLDVTSFDPWVVVGPMYGPWTAVRAPTRNEQRQAPTRVTVLQAGGSEGGRADFIIPAGSGPAGVAVVNDDGTVVFLQPRRAR
jgi:outer membrane protein assembly factor BamB